MFRFFAAATVLALVAASGLAQNKKLPAQDPAANLKSNQNAIRPSREKAREGTASPRLSTMQHEVYNGIGSIPANNYVKIDSGLDYSSCDTIRVTVLSANDDLTNDVTNGSQGLAIVAAWSVLDSNVWVAAEVVFANQQFTFSNMGGAVFNTYGNQLELQLWNLNSTPMTIAQVLIVGRVY